MGLAMGFSDCKTLPPNPNPQRFKVIKTYRLGELVAVMLNYPRCITFEGNKVLVMLESEFLKCRKSKVLDPHFRNTENSPVSRFPGNDAGWRDAIIYLECKNRGL